MTFTYPILETRPWAFSLSELTAGLRQFTGEPSINVVEVQEHGIPYQRPGRGRIRGFRAICESDDGPRYFEMVVKEPRGVTRAGTASAGWREVSFYRTLVDQIPITVPDLVAAEPAGEWMVLDLVPGWLLPEQWTDHEYKLAIDQLVCLHDRFWGLAEDLSTYIWLSRPLDADFEVYRLAAEIGLQRLKIYNPDSLLNREPELISNLERLVKRAGKVAAALRTEKATLLHGDYWPGNIIINPTGKLYTIDWQRTAIGPAILDLVNFIKLSQWFFETLPISVEELVQRYRQGMAKAVNVQWRDDTWEVLWDYALLWIFLADWSDLLANIPNSLLSTQRQLLETVWFEPVEAAVERRLKDIA